MKKRYIKKVATKELNYLSASFWLALFVFVIMIGLWFVPTFSNDYFSTRQVNVLSDVVSDSTIEKLVEKYRINQMVDQVLGKEKVAITKQIVRPPKMGRVKSVRGEEGGNVVEDDNKTQEVESKIGDISNRSDQEDQYDVSQQASLEYDQIKGDQNVEVKEVAVPENIKQVKGENSSKVPNIENINDQLFQSFLSKLKGRKKIRVAVAGDSFIEGDIFTQDLRESLQAKYGGEGVGYVPITSTVAGFRQSVEHRFSGWNTKSVVNSSGNFHLSGYVFIPNEGAWVRYKGSSYRKHLKRFNNAKFIFVNKGNTIINAVVNDTIKMSFTPPSGDYLQSISINENIESVKFSVTNVAGFIGYGAVLDGTSGVSVDNYSIRSYSGAGLARMKAEIVNQWQEILPYDLIILQYGLNVANEAVTNYSKYGQTLYEVIYNLKNLMPNCAILVMSVSDRQNRSGKTMPSIYALEQTQRAVASDCGVPFWSTLYAMQNAGGMGAFVKKGWAAKDFTHLSHKGGKVVADIFIQAIEAKTY